MTRILATLLGLSLAFLPEQLPLTGAGKGAPTAGGGGGGGTVTLDTSAEFETTGATSVSGNVTIANNTDRILYALITQAEGGDLVSTATCTYNSVGMSTFFTDTTGGDRSARVQYLTAPTTGTNQLSCSWTGTQPGYVIAISLYNVDQTTPHDTQQVQDGSGGGTSSTVNVSSAANNMVLDLLINGNGATALTTGANQTELQQRTGGAAGLHGVLSSWEAGAGTVTMTASWTGFTTFRYWAWDVNAN